MIPSHPRSPGLDLFCFELLGATALPTYEVMMMMVCDAQPEHGLSVFVLKDVEVARARQPLQIPVHGGEPYLLAGFIHLAMQILSGLEPGRAA